VILTPDCYRVEESMKFGTKSLQVVGVRNKFSLGTK